MSLKQLASPLVLAATALLTVLAASPASAGTASVATKWTVQKTPNPATGGSAAGSNLNDVSCSAASACTAVGVHIGKGTDVPFAERWHGSAWKLQTLPGHGTAGNLDLNSVSCPSAADCFAVGGVGNGTAELATAYRWNGSSWSQFSTASPKGAELWAVACPGTKSCIAVGVYATNSTTTYPYSLRWNGATWSRLSMPKIKGGLNFLSCTSASNCEATGGAAPSASASLPLAERWNGKTWTKQQVPLPGGASVAALGGVSCSSAANCVSVGATASGGYAEKWNGSHWAVTAAFPNAAADLPNQLACRPDGYCIAAGSLAGTQPKVLVLSWNGITWSTVPAASPAGPFSVLAGVSCPAAATVCTAVGTYQHGQGQDTLAERGPA